MTTITHENPPVIDFTMLPYLPSEAEEINPRILVIAGKEGVGKTKALSMLGSSTGDINDLAVIADTENSTSYLKCVRVHLLHVSNYLGAETKEERKARWEKGDYYLDEFLKHVKHANDQIRKRTNGAQQYFYKYGIIDTATRLDQWMEIAGTYRYMAITQGKKFNLKPGRPGEKYNHLDKEFETVHDLEHGYGFRHSRDETVKWLLEEIPKVFKHTIISCHVISNRSTEKNSMEEDVKSTMLDLTGTTKFIVARKADAVGFLYRDDNKLMINFEVKDQNAKGRCTHLNEKKICLIEKNPDDTFTSHWDSIFI